MIGKLDVVKSEKLLHKLDEDWYKRLDIVEQLRVYFTDKELSDEDYVRQLKKFRLCFGRQFEDPRSKVIKEFCTKLQGIAEAKPHQFCLFLPFFWVKCQMILQRGSN
eukprot:UN00888